MLEHPAYRLALDLLEQEQHGGCVVAACLRKRSGARAPSSLQSSVVMALLAAGSALDLKAGGHDCYGERTPRGLLTLKAQLCETSQMSLKMDKKYQRQKSR